MVAKNKQNNCVFDVEAKSPTQAKAGDPTQAQAEDEYSLLTKIFLLAGYMTVGPGLILMNKFVLTTVGFPYPVLLSSLGLVTTTICTQIAHRNGQLALPHAEAVTLSFYLTNVLPIGALHATTIASGNWVYLYAGIAVIQFFKAFTPMNIAILGFLVIGKKPKFYAGFWLAALVSATFLSVEGDTSATFFGVILAAICSVADALRLVLQEFLLKDKKFGLWEGMYFFAPAGGTFLVLVGLAMEGPTIHSEGHYMKLLEFPAHFAFVGLGGLGVVTLNTSVIKVTNAVTLKSLAIIRNGSLVVAGMLIYGEELKRVQLIGYIFSVVFFAFFQKFSQADQKPESFLDMLKGTKTGFIIAVVLSLLVWFIPDLDVWNVAS